MAVKPWVLVVDDLALNRKLMGALARRLGFATVEAVNGAEALQMVENSTAPWCILLDLQMPVLDGWSTAKRLRSLDGVLSSVPIIACTACNLAEASKADAAISLEQQTLACGINMCLNKPLNLAQLTAALHQLSVPCPVNA